MHSGIIYARQHIVTNRLGANERKVGVEKIEREGAGRQRQSVHQERKPERWGYKKNRKKEEKKRQIG